MFGRSETRVLRNQLVNGTVREVIEETRGRKTKYYAYLSDGKRYDLKETSKGWTTSEEI